MKLVAISPANKVQPEVDALLVVANHYSLAELVRQFQGNEDGDLFRLAQEEWPKKAPRKRYALMCDCSDERDVPMLAYADCHSCVQKLIAAAFEQLQGAELDTVGFAVLLDPRETVAHESWIKQHSLLLSSTGGCA